MAITTIENVAVALGEEPPDAESVTAKQWELWIGAAERIINRRYAPIGGITMLDPDEVKYVVGEAVAMKYSNPRGMKQTSVSVDDGSVSESMSEASPDVTILPQWWKRLTPPEFAAARQPARTTYVKLTTSRLRKGW